MNTLLNTDHFGLAGKYPFHRGKVRDIYDLGEQLLIITTDRLSAFDVVLPQPIPYKGAVLNGMSALWFGKLEHVFSDMRALGIPMRHHLVSTNSADLSADFQPFIDELEHRFMIVEKCDVLPVECIVRGYISGSLWKEYQRACKEQTGDMVTIHGHPFPRGLQESEVLSLPIFTPSTKAEAGMHDENIDFVQMESIIADWLRQHGYTDTFPGGLAKALQEASLAMYCAAAVHAKERGIIIADTKFEFGIRFIDGQLSLVLVDEVLSPDSSRFWPVDQYQVGQSQPSFDKQPVRDYLESLGWDKKPPAPDLPVEIVTATTERYRTAMRLLFDATLAA